ncbi:MAG TPA: hypothetical protein PKA12_09110 [Saprospiraceae bacterium]|nr:hypothetical protein [Saprospiraceae bacterium]
MKVFKFKKTSLSIFLLLSIWSNDAKAWIIKFKGFGIEFCISNESDACGKMSIPNLNGGSIAYFKGKKLNKSDVIDYTIDAAGKVFVSKSKNGLTSERLSSNSLSDILIKTNKETISLDTYVKILQECKKS